MTQAKKTSMMLPRAYVPMIVTLLSVWTGCGADLDDGERGAFGDRSTAARDQDGGAASGSQGSDAGPASQPGKQGDGGAGGSDGTPGQAPQTVAEGCQATALVPPLACVSPEPLEASGDAPTLLRTEQSCASVLTGLSSDTDEDVYKLKPQKSDPVRVELVYINDEAGELDFQVRDQAGNSAGENRLARKAPQENAVLTFNSNAAFAYEVEVWGRQLDSCQPYALRVDTQYCTDAYEDNDSGEESHKLAWQGDQPVTIDASSYPRDDDYYELVPSKRDPVLVTGSYTVADAVASADLQWVVYGVGGQTLAENRNTRTGLRESWSTWVSPLEANQPLQLRVYADSGSCVPYQIKLDAAACTDAYEDNDREEQAVKLPAQGEASATLLDDDFYDLTALPGAGLCIIKYSVPATSSQRLAVSVDAAGTNNIAGMSEVTDGDQHTLTVKWTGAAAAQVISIRGQERACTPYTIRCSVQ